MKKINIAVYITLLVLSVFTCKRQASMKEYIEKGFAKPILEGDAHFTKEKTTDNGKIYVPSKEEIEVQFTVKNKYNQELTGEVEVPQDKKALFDKVPEIKELTATKVVIAFNFNQEAEPKETNQFVGESVGITVKIFEKRTGRFLSSQTITANCNTAPPSIKTDDVMYKEETDEYLVTLPKGEGIHRDLKEVHFILSSTYSDEKAEPKVISIIDIGEQGKQCTLKIKGNEGWQLKHPGGQRNIKAIVYDRAGLKSDENDQEKSKTKRFFTSITLLPSSKDISVKKARETGVPIPKIAELEEFFNGDNWQNESGYSVEYSDSTPLGFEYDSKQKVFKNPNALAATTYKITVTLKQGALYSTPVEADFTIKVVGDNVAAIDQDSLIITDITNYPDGKPALQFDGSTLEFPIDSYGVATATVNVPYTTFDTELSVKVEAVAEECKGQDEGSDTYWSPQQYKTEYIRKVGNEPDNRRSDIEFTITSPNGNVKQKYKISLVRETSPSVKIEFDKGLLPTGSTARAKMTWKYAKEEFAFTVGGVQDKYLTVGKNEYVDFDISVGDGVRIEECRSDFGHHQIEGSGGNIRIQAVSNFKLNIKLKPESTVKWDNYLRPENKCGYTSGKITYGKGASETSYTPNTPDVGHAVIKGEPVKFKVEMLTTGQYKVEHWLVDGETISESKSDGSITLEEDKTLLTIKSADAKDYVVSVVTKRTSPIPENEATINSEKSTIRDISTYSNEDLRLKSFPNLQFSGSGTPLTQDVPVDYTGIDTTLRVHIEAGSRYCKGKDENGTLWADSWKKDYDVVLDKDSDRIKELKFTIVAEDGVSEKNYVLTFKRGESAEVNLKFEHEILSGSAKIANAKISWDYAEKEINYNASGAPNEIALTVRKDSYVEIKIGVEEDVKVASCISTISTHNTAPVNSTTKLAPKGGKITLKAVGSFTITTKLIPSAMVKWKDYRKEIQSEEPKAGYTSGKIICERPNGSSPEELTPSNTYYAVKEGKPVTFKIEDLATETCFVEKWIVNNEDVTENTDKFHLNGEKTELKILSAEGKYDVEVVVKRFCNVDVCLFKGTPGHLPYELVADHKCEIKVKKIGDLIPLTPHAVDSNRSKYEYKKIKPGEALEITATLQNDSTYEIQSWTYKETGGGETQFLAGADGVHRKRIEKDTTINVLLQKKTVELVVEFNKNGHNYELKAHDTSTTLQVDPATGSTADTYKYNVVSGTKVKLNVTKKTGHRIPYGIEKWSDITGASPSQAFGSKYEVEVTVEQNKKLQIDLLPQYTFTLSPKSSGCSGVLSIAKSATETQTLEEVSTRDNPKTKTILTNERELYFKVAGLGTDNLVVGYRRKANDGTNDEMTYLFNSDTGFWKVKDNGEKNLKLNIEAGDEFEVVLDRVKYIKLSVRELDDYTVLYNGKFKLTVTKDSNDSNVDHMLFPKRPGGHEIIINKDSFSPRNKVFDMYITQGTKIEFKMDDLDNEREIGAWKERDDDLKNGNLNDLDEESNVLIGRNPASYIFNGNNYSTLELNACIRRHETVELKLEIASYTEFSENAGIYMPQSIYAYYQDSPVPFLTVKAREHDGIRRFRVQKGTHIKIKADAQDGDDHRSYFAFWSIIPDGFRYSLEVGGITMNQNYDIKGYYTDKIIVVMHEIQGDDKKPENFVASALNSGSFGNTKITMLTNVGADRTPSYTIANDTETRKQLGVNSSQENKQNALISKINKGELNGIRLEVEGIDITSTPHWRYSFGGDGITPQYDTTSATGVGKPKPDGQTIIFGKYGDHDWALPIFGVLHLWLYKAK